MQDHDINWLVWRTLDKKKRNKGADPTKQDIYQGCYDVWHSEEERKGYADLMANNLKEAEEEGFLESYNQDKNCRVSETEMRVYTIKRYKVTKKGVEVYQKSVFDQSLLDQLEPHLLGKSNLPPATEWKTFVIEEKGTREDLDPDSYCPRNVLTLDVKILRHAQHDGRSWGQEYIDEQNKELMNEIMAELKEKIALHLVRTDPYGIHR